MCFAQLGRSDPVGVALDELLIIAEIFESNSALSPDLKSGQTRIGRKFCFINYHVIFKNHGAISRSGFEDILPNGAGVPSCPNSLFPKHLVLESEKFTHVCS